MGIVVVKFGGGALSNRTGFQRAVEIVKSHRRIGNSVIVVVSAMGKTTDRLLKMAEDLGPAILPARELDLLLSSGERISMSLFSIALAREGIKARSYTGSQVGIITDSRHSQARIVEVKGDRIRSDLEHDIVPIVAGFQGVSRDREVTTLGRGGSDVTALALAAAFNCRQCYLYTDVDGLFTEDPRSFPEARPIREISYEEMFELSSRGAIILHPRACAIAARNGVEVWTGRQRGLGTWIREGKMEKPGVKAITHQPRVNIITLIGVPRQRGTITQVITQLAREGIGVRSFFHGVGEREFDLSFILRPEDGDRALALIKAINLSPKQTILTRDLGSVTLVGYGAGTDVSILNRLFSTLERNRIHIYGVTTSELSITCIIKRRKVKGAVSALLKEFQLTGADRRRSQLI
ncbi:aspartate kinase [candidate division WOR-3 bacterium]|uniref:Aspartokinase n=1 Tax=candidate division WOR-3 bacterium TaxID=2052148 RepID=A0A660SDB4_UNCW3|nr:MAG: aspartate kinase [candidate division WOR-3 bacterium]